MVENKDKKTQAQCETMSKQRHQMLAKMVQLVNIWCLPSFRLNFFNVKMLVVQPYVTVRGCVTADLLPHFSNKA